jgi:hypothetical protein
MFGRTNKSEDRRVTRRGYFRTDQRPDGLPARATTGRSFRKAGPGCPPTWSRLLFIAEIPLELFEESLSTATDNIDNEHTCYPLFVVALDHPSRLCLSERSVKSHPQPRSSFSCYCGRGRGNRRSSSSRQPLRSSCPSGSRSAARYRHSSRSIYVCRAASTSNSAWAASVCTLDHDRVADGLLRSIS